MLDMAAYLIIEPVLEVISNIIVKTVPASKLLAVYHKAGLLLNSHFCCIPHSYYINDILRL